MCGDNGEKITTPASESRKVRPENGGGVFKIIKEIFRNVVNFFAKDQDTVNSCSNCGDLQIEGEWLKIPLFPYRFFIKGAIDNGGIKVSGQKKLCNSCNMEVKEELEKLKTTHNGLSYVLHPV